MQVLAHDYLDDELTVQYDQNLFRTLTESQVQATPHLKLLLNTVKDARVRIALTVPQQ